MLYLIKKYINKKHNLLKNMLCKRATGGQQVAGMNELEGAILLWINNTLSLKKSYSYSFTTPALRATSPQAMSLS